MMGFDNVVTKPLFRRVLFLALSLCPISAFGLSPREVADKTLPSLVVLYMQDANGRPMSQGSGFLVESDLVATNYHVIQGANSGYAKLPKQPGSVYEILGVTGVNRQHDLALLRIKATQAKPLSIADSNKAAVGDEIFAAGSPLGLEATFSTGIVSSLRELNSERLIQITAPISPGSSGGPVLNRDGDVIGITVLYISGGQNLNFAVPANYLKELLSAKTRLLPLAEVDLKSTTSGQNSVAQTGQSAPQELPSSKNWDASREQCRQGSGTECFNMALTAIKESATEQAVFFVTKGCEKDNADSCLLLGLREDNQGQFSDARNHYDKACALNSIEGCHDAALLEFRRKHVSESFRLAKLACATGYADSCELAGRIKFNSGILGEARDYYRKACEKNRYESCNNLGVADERLKNFKSAIAAYSKACEGNIGIACSNFAAMAQRNGILKPEEALDLRKIGCKLGDAEACAGVGYIEEKRGHLEEAATHYQLACDKNNAPACVRLAAAYKSAGRTKDAATLLSKFCNSQSSLGCSDLGLIEYENKNYVEATRVFQLGCTNGSAVSCREQGRVEMDKGNSKEAMRLFSFACARKDSGACLYAAKAEIERGRSPAGISFIRKAREILNGECKAGDNDSCERLTRLK